MEYAAVVSVTRALFKSPVSSVADDAVFRLMKSRLSARKVDPYYSRGGLCRPASSKNPRIIDAGSNAPRYKIFIILKHPLKLFPKTQSNLQYNINFL